MTLVFKKVKFCAKLAGIIGMNMSATNHDKRKEKELHLGKIR